MLQIGKSITTQNDPLKTIRVADLFEHVTQPSPELISKINQLRILNTIDRQKYQQLKKTLPYVTCGIFSPTYRRTQNFGSIIHFFIDIDHLSSKEKSIEQVKTVLMKDDRVEMIYTSPGNDGLKVLFKLQEKCFDPAKYSIFYKLFIHQFSEKYELEQVVDKSTSDVARACFLSVDEEAYFNADPNPVNMLHYINFENELEVIEAGKLFKEQEKEYKEQNDPIETAEKKELPTDILLEIRKKLNPNIRVTPDKQLFVPEEIDRVVSLIEKRMAEFDILLKSSDPINFGKKFVFSLGSKWAQLNVFYGKKGYKVVMTPITGSDRELSEIVFRLLCEMFY